jgi:hypothetical protein
MAVLMEVTFADIRSVSRPKDLTGRKQTTWQEEIQAGATVVDLLLNVDNCCVTPGYADCGLLRAEAAATGNGKSPA